MKSCKKAVANGSLEEMADRVVANGGALKTPELESHSWANRIEIGSERQELPPLWRAKKCPKVNSSHRVLRGQR